ncbi:hypothetical protein L484_015817 [Morus notabilis]|uniref:Uncharacterized protein n=1 Tax=Morus notabilis TaxID=981085 RepID=W9RDW2_9ROSA|nr:hypothetical protein L484_015817 [Morus notabilis]
MKAWLVCLVLILSAAAAVVDQAVAAPGVPSDKNAKLSPKLNFEDPCSSPGGPYPGCDYRKTPRKQANAYNRGCAKFYRCRSYFF